MKPQELDKRIADMLKPGEMLTADNFNPAIKQLLADVIAAVTPDEWDEGDGWDVFFGKERQCCPGDDIAYSHNHAIKEIQANTKRMGL